MLLRFAPFSAHAGFPSPGEHHVEHSLSLDDLVAFDREATYFVTVEGNSMYGANISSGDILVVSRAIEPTSHAIVVVTLDSRFLVKRILYDQNGSITLSSEHPAYPPVRVTETMRFSVWGVAVFVLHPLHPLAAHRLHPPSDHKP